jgi:hypothetical protein
MRYSRMAAKPPKKKRRFTNFFIVIIILGIAAYLIGAGAAGSWIAENIIDPVFNGGTSNAAPPTNTESADTTAPNETIKPVDLPGASGTRAEEEITAQEVNLYALQTGAFSEESNAKSAATALQSQGGAGYIAYDGDLYRVLIAGYTDPDDASEVKTSLKKQSIDATLFNLKSGTLKFKIGAEQSQIAAVKACFDIIPQTVEDLQQIIFDADKGSDVEQAITTLKQNVISATGNFEAAVTSEEGAMQSLQSYMRKFSSTVNELPVSASSASAAKFSSDLKYSLIQIVVDYSSFLNELNS